MIQWFCENKPRFPWARRSLQPQLFGGDVFSHVPGTKESPIQHPRGSLLFSIQRLMVGSSCLPAAWHTGPQAAARTLSRSLCPRCCSGPGTTSFLPAEALSPGQGAAGPMPRAAACAYTLRTDMKCI